MPAPGNEKRGTKPGLNSGNFRTRYEIAQLPEFPKTQRNWKYQVFSGAEGQDHLLVVRHGSKAGSRAYAWTIPSGAANHLFSRELRSFSGDPMPAMRMADLDDDSINSLSKGLKLLKQGTLQVHDAGKDRFYGTMQDGKVNASFELNRSPNDKWSLVPRGAPSPRNLTKDLMSRVGTFTEDVMVPGSRKVGSTQAGILVGAGAGTVAAAIASTVQEMRVPEMKFARYSGEQIANKQKTASGIYPSTPQFGDTLTTPFYTHPGSNPYVGPGIMAAVGGIGGAALNLYKNKRMRDAGYTGPGDSLLKDTLAGALLGLGTNLGSNAIIGATNRPGETPGILDDIFPGYVGSKTPGRGEGGYGRFASPMGDEAISERLGWTENGASKGPLLAGQREGIEEGARTDFTPGVNSLHRSGGIGGNQPLFDFRNVKIGKKIASDRDVTGGLVYGSLILSLLGSGLIHAETSRQLGKAINETKKIDIPQGRKVLDDMGLQGVPLIQEGTAGGGFYAGPRTTLKILEQSPEFKEKIDTWAKEQGETRPYEEVFSQGMIVADPAYMRHGIIAHEGGHAQIRNLPEGTIQRTNQTWFRPISGIVNSIATTPVTGFTAYQIGKRLKNPLSRVAAGAGTGMAISGIINSPTLINEWQASNRAMDSLKGKMPDDEWNKEKNSLQKAYNTYLMGSLAFPAVWGGVAGGALGSVGAR